MGLIGFILSIMLFWRIAEEATVAEEAPWFTPYGFAVAMLVLGFLAGFILIKTVGIASVGLVAGGIVSIPISIFNGALGASGGYLLIAIVGIVLQQTQRARLASVGIYI